MPLSKSVAWRNRLRRKLNNCRLFIAYMYGSFFSLIFIFYLSLSLYPPLSPPLSLSLSLPLPPPLSLSLSLSLSLPDKNLSSGHLLVSSTLLALDRKCSRWSVLEGDTESLDTYLSRELVFWQCSVFTLFQKLLQNFPPTLQVAVK